MNFLIDIANAKMYVSSVPASISMSGLPAASYIAWGDGSGGTITYPGQLNVGTATFSDPSSYQSYFNAWITAMAANAPALSLAQAKFLKCGFINSVYNAKRQLPASVAVSAGNFAFDVSDAGLIKFIPMVGLILVDQINSISSGLTTNAQAAITGVTTKVNSSIGTLNSNLATNNADIQQWLGGSIGFTPSEPTISATTVSSVAAIAEPTFQMVPIGGTSPIVLTGADMQAIFTAAVNRNAGYQVTNATKQAAVNALSTIAAVAAYDATAGW
jgi:hypothetical protein